MSESRTTGHRGEGCIITETQHQTDRQTEKPTEREECDMVCMCIEKERKKRGESYQ